MQIKKNRKDTYIDLSEEKIFSRDFINKFSEFTLEIESFLSGGSVSLILPELGESEYKNLKQDYEKLLGKIKYELNKKNISLKACISADNILDNAAKSSQELDKKMPKNPQKSKQELDLSELPETLYIKAQLRAGQLIRYPGNVFIYGDVNPSAEIIAAGDIIVWGNLRGVAHAGAAGDESAIIAAHKILSGQLRISDKILELASNSFKSKKSQKSSSNDLAKIENNEIIIS
jgi:septum site-determining protein MinC